MHSTTFYMEYVRLNCC